MFPLGDDPVETVRWLIVRIPALLLAVSFHEFSHAWLAVWLGDGTPAKEGRLTMSPISHLDPIGALMLVLVGFGWARPVRVQGSHFRRPLRDIALVAAAGLVANLVLAVVSALGLRVMRERGGVEGPTATPLWLMLQASFEMNVGLAVFNLLPIPPLDGSRVLLWLLPARPGEVVARLEAYAPLLLLLLLATGLFQPILTPLVSSVQGAIRWGTGL